MATPKKDRKNAPDAPERTKRVAVGVFTVAALGALIALFLALASPQTTGRDALTGLSGAGEKKMSGKTAMNDLRRMLRSPNETREAITKRMTAKTRAAGEKGSATGKKTGLPAAGLTLDGIISSGGEYLAVIGGEIRRPADTVDGCVIVNVTPDEVELVCGSGKSVRLRVKK